MRGQIVGIDRQGRLVIFPLLFKIIEGSEIDTNPKTIAGIIRMGMRGLLQVHQRLCCLVVGQQKTPQLEMDIGINREHRDVGLKRMELLDKMLSNDLLAKKRDHVHKVEQD